MRGKSLQLAINANPAELWRKTRAETGHWLKYEQGREKILSMVGLMLCHVLTEWTLESYWLRVFFDTRGLSPKLSICWITVSVQNDVVVFFNISLNAANCNHLLFWHQENSFYVIKITFTNEVDDVSVFQILSENKTCECDILGITTSEVGITIIRISHEGSMSTAPL